MPELSWRTRAACRGVNSDVFFTTRGDPARVAEALEYCAVCPVTDECLDYAMAMPTGFRELGVWGSTTPKQRRRLRRKAAA